MRSNTNWNTNAKRLSSNPRGGCMRHIADDIKSKEWSEKKYLIHRKNLSWAAAIECDEARSLGDQHRVWWSNLLHCCYRWIVPLVYLNCTMARLKPTIDPTITFGIEGVFKTTIIIWVNENEKKKKKKKKKKTKAFTKKKKKKKKDGKNKAWLFSHI